MKNFMLSKLHAGAIPVSYVRRPMMCGTEAEFRWKRYANSKYEQIKVSYNVSDEEHEISQQLFDKFFTSAAAQSRSKK